jgi:glycosyltransferase involved in cell wall biosynthesis
LRGLSQYHDVTLLSFSDQPEETLEIREIRSLCSEVKIVPWREFNPQSRKSIIGFLSPTPRFLLDTYSISMEGLIQNSLSSKKYDLVIASQLSMATYYKSFENIHAIFDEIELGIFYEAATKTEGLLSRLRRALTWFKLRRYFSKLLNSFVIGSVVSEQELNLVASHLSKHLKRISVIPNSINFDDYQELNVKKVPARLIFTGSFRFHANYEAMKWFVGEVFPRILKKEPEVQLVITGDHAVLPLPSVENVTLAGYVEDIKRLIASAQISIAPLLTGGGTRLKILEAMAIGTPVVATSKGAEGLGAEDGKQILLADSPDDFADRVLTLLRDAELHEKLSVNGKLFVKKNYDWKSVVPRFLLLVERIGNNDGEA